MLKYKIRQPETKQDISADVELKVWLEKDEDGNVDLMASLEDNRICFVATLRRNGTLYRYRDVGAELGFKLNEYGRIMLG